jgi:hypothetical protein
MAPTWIRVKDRDTGHEFDLHEEDPRLGTSVVEVLKDYPANSSSTAQARPPKYRVDKAGQPVTPTGQADIDVDQVPATEQSAGDDPTGEQTTAGTSAKKRRNN